MELGALSLRIQEEGLDAVLAALKATEKGAKQAADLEKVLNREIAETTKLWASMARTADVSNKSMVGQLRNLAAEQSNYLRQLGATDTQQLAHARNVQVFQGRVERAEAAQKRQLETTTLFGHALTTNTGKLSAFSSRAITGLNAAAFSLSAFASGGEVGFRSLASAASGFLAFLGPEGAIASLAITTGLSLSDFFRRTRKEIDETKEAALKAAAAVEGQLESARRSRDPAGVVEKLADDTRELQEKTVKLASLEHIAEHARTEEQKQQITLLRERIRLLNQEIGIGKQAALSQRDQPRTGTLGGVTVTATDPKKAEEERRKAISDRVSALSDLHRLNLLSGADLVELARLERVLREELEKGTATLTRRAEIEKQRAQIREASLKAPATQSILSGRPQPVKAFDGAAIQQAIKNAPKPPSNVINPRLQELQDTLSNGIAASIASGITDGFARGFAEGGIGEGFRQLTSQMLSGLGSMAIETGLAQAAIAEKVAAFSQWLIANPLAAVGIGIALAALGSQLGGRRGGGSVGGGGFASTSASTPLSIRRLIVDPNAGVGRSLLPVSTSGLVAPMSPFDGVSILAIDRPAGGRQVAAIVNNANARKGRS